MERDISWRKEAACKDSSPDLYYQPSWMTDAMWNTVSEASKDFCRSCKVETECYDFADKNNEKHGIWGGVDFGKSARTRRSQRRKELALKLKK